MLPMKSKPNFLSNPNPLATARDVFDKMIEVHQNYLQVKEFETSRRVAILAQRDVQIAKIQAEKEILQKYLNNQFAERKYMIDGMFERLDKGIESGDTNLINGSLQAIVDIAKQSPLAQAQQILADINNSDVKSIDW